MTRFWYWNNQPTSIQDNSIPMYDKKIREDFKEIEYYRRIGFINDLKNKLIDISNKFKYFSDIIGPAASERQNLIKSAFKTIFDSVLPNPMKFMMLWVEKGTNATSKDYERLLKMQKFSAFAELKNPKYGKIDQVFYEAKIDVKARNKLLALAPKILDIRNSIKWIIKNLVVARNKLLKTQKGFDIVKMLISANINPLSLSNILEFWEKIEKENKLTTHTVWEIKSKSFFSFSGSTSDDELTEED